MNRAHTVRPVPPTPPGPIVVEVSDTQSHVRVDPEALARLVRVTLGSEGVSSANVSLAIVDDATIRVINRRHLGHDWPTDVISFVLSEPSEAVLSGELVVSGEMASDTARRAGGDARDELALYVVHGLLHLCGHDDLEPVPRAEMRRREGEVLASAGLPNTFPAAVAVGTEDPLVRETPPWAS